MEGVDFEGDAVRGGKKTCFALGLNMYLGADNKLKSTASADISQSGRHDERPGALAALVGVSW